MTVGRLRHGTEELQAQPHQPLERPRGVLRQEPAQLQIAPSAEATLLIEEPHVLGEFLRGILDPLSSLVRGPAGGNGSHRQQRGAAEMRVLFQEDHAAAAFRSLQRRGEPGTPAAHHHDVCLDSADCPALSWQSHQRRRPLNKSIYRQLPVARSAYRLRSSAFRTLPVAAVTGSDSTNSTNLGFLNPAKRPRTNSTIPSLVRDGPSSGTTTANTDSPHSRSGIPTTATPDRK